MFFLDILSKSHAIYWMICMKMFGRTFPQRAGCHIPFPWAQLSRWHREVTPSLLSPEAGFPPIDTHSCWEHCRMGTQDRWGRTGASGQDIGRITLLPSPWISCTVTVLKMLQSRLPTIYRGGKKQSKKIKTTKTFKITNKKSDHRPLPRSGSKFLHQILYCEWC